MPPPSTRFSSPSQVFILISCAESISCILSGLDAFETSAGVDFHAFFSSFWIISSAMVFHSLQELHCPCHLEYCAPQLLQKKVVFTFDINYLCSLSFISSTLSSMFCLVCSAISPS